MHKRNNKTGLFISIILFIAICFFAACKKDLIDPHPGHPDNPETENHLGLTFITSVSANTGVYGATVVINGVGFSSTIANNQVYFNNKQAPVSAATTTKLTVTVPLSAGIGLITLRVNNGLPVIGPLFIYRRSWVVSTFAGNGIPALTDGKGTAASFNVPDGITIDKSGNLFVTEQANYAVRKITSSAQVTTVAGGTFGYMNGVGTAARFFVPSGLTIDPAGNLFVAEYGNNQIRKIDPSTLVTSFAGNSDTSPGLADGLGAAAAFHGPADMVRDKNGNFFIADYGNELIRKMTPAGLVSTFSNILTPGVTDYVAPYHFCAGITMDSKGNLYTTDLANFLVQKITPAGVVSTFAGSGTKGTANGKGNKASFNSPYRLAVDADDNIYVTDINVIRKIDKRGVVTNFAGTEAAGALDGPAAAASFNYLIGIVVDKRTGDVYVADGSNNLIRKISFQ